MKIIALLAAGRAGADFLQSLFDGHPEVSQLPGYFNINEFLNNSSNDTSLESIAGKFINNNEKFFDSRKNLIERHNMLGEDRKSFYLISRDTFKKNFIDLFKNKEITKHNIICNLHYAYSLASGEDLKKKKIIILNVHHISRLKVLQGLNYEVIYMIRNPMASLCSAVKDWLQYENGKHVSPWWLYYHIERVFNGLKTLLKLNLKVHVIQLELLHRQNTKVMREVSEKLDIAYYELLENSTYHGKLWWGDLLSNKNLSGVNPNFENTIDHNFFYKKDIKCLETYLSPFMSKYNYQTSKKILKFKIIKFLPLKIELEIWKKTILLMRIKEISSIFYYWMKRITLMKNDIYENVNFPDSLGK